MISLTRLSGSVFVLNADLIERLDHTPDTVITLVDGKKYVVTESMDEVVDAIRDYRAGVIAASHFPPTSTVITRPPHLVPVSPRSAGQEAD